MSASEPLNRSDEGSASAYDLGLLPLPTFGGSGVLPGVDLADGAALRELMDDGPESESPGV